MKNITNLTEVKLRLCIHDERNPNRETCYDDDPELKPDRDNCFCDNCFYGRDALARFILERIQE